MLHKAISRPELFEERAVIRTEADFRFDHDSFCALYQETAPALQGYIRKSCGRASLTEDILQETFYRFLRANLPKMGVHQERSYLFKIASSLLVDHWRREKREKFWRNLWHPPAKTQDGDTSDVTRALAAMKPVERALLLLAYVEGFNHAEIASTLDLAEKSIRVRLFRARKNLMRILERRNVICGASL
jgi:RNA polymerase sigma-70 factor (ECF subfamily)